MAIIVEKIGRKSGVSNKVNIWGTNIIISSSHC